VLAGDRAARVDAKTHDLLAQLQNALGRARFAVVEHQVRVQIAVPGVEYVGDGHVVALTSLVDAREYVWQARARYNAVQDVVARC